MLDFTVPNSPGWGKSVLAAEGSEDGHIGAISPRMLAAIETISQTPALLDTPTPQAGPCHECGAPMIRANKPRTVAYNGQSEIVDMPGWYCDGCGDSIHSGTDMSASGQALRRLKALAENAATEK